jgi:hypothetical protein
MLGYMKMAVFWVVMDAVSFSETSVNIYQTTWCNIPEDSHFDTRRRENLKHHAWTVIFHGLLTL